MYDVTRAETFNNVHVWLDYVRECRRDDVLVFLVGNKIDQQEREVSLEDVK